MGLTTFTGPVQSLNGFISGSPTEPIVVDTAGNISSAYATAENTTGDVRLQYQRLTVASTGSGETGRWLTRVTGVGAATGGTVNGGHISLSINSPGTVSGAGNALRLTIGGTSTNPGGTLAALQLDSDFATGGTWTNTAYIRCTNSGSGTIDTFAVLPDAMIAGESAAAVSHVIPIKNASGSTFYLMVSNAA